MEHNQNLGKKKKKNNKPLFILVGALAFFSFFIYLIARPGQQQIAIEQIQVSNNINDVKAIYDRYRFDLLESDENGNKIISPEFQEAVRNKLQSLKLTDEELTECLKWIPPTRTNLNLIVVPDLSRRILLIPQQVENDISALSAIWNSFEKFSKFRQDTKDKLKIDVTIDQSNPIFESIANELNFDLSSHKGKSNRLYFNEERSRQFNDKINEMYASAIAKPLGSDYILYFRRDLQKNIKKPTLFDDYQNKIIVLTDGYIELEESRDYGNGKRWDYTPCTSLLYNSVNIGNTNNEISRLGLNIPVASGVDLSNTEILICEVNERNKGKDFEILKAYWTDWLQRMKVPEKNISFIGRNSANNITKQQIEEFIKN